MKSYLFIVLCLLGGFQSCEPKKEVLPADILPEDKMVNVMIDIQLLEGVFSHRNMRRDSAMQMYHLYEKDIFRKHKITDSIYIKSFNYYSDHTQVMDKIYERIVDSLSLREGQKRLY